MYLKNKKIVITRTQPGAGRLAILCRQLGAKPIIFPTIEIMPCVLNQQLQQNLTRLQYVDKIIFFSPNAVKQCVVLCQQYQLPIPQHVEFFAVGQSTAEVLQQQWQCQVHYPQPSFDSESLLAMPQLANVNGQIIVIVAGVGGRELLEQELTTRGAKVQKLSLYQRVCARSRPQPLLLAWEQDEIAIIVTTSIDGLKNLFTIVGEQGKAYLLQTPLLVISDRMQQQAISLGYQAALIIKATSAQDYDIMNTLKNYFGEWL